MKILVIDGQGGRMGKALVETLRRRGFSGEILAVGTNSAATAAMLKAGADEGATGENAIVHNMQHVDVVMGVIGILNANAMMGELSPAMAVAIGSSHTYKILLPINRCHIHVVSVEDIPLSVHLDNAVKALREYLEQEGVVV
jgi:hypothetical protein